MSSAELKQLSRIHDKLDDGFDSLGGKLDQLIAGQKRSSGKLDRIDGKLDRLIVGQEQVISLLAEQTRLLRGLVAVLSREEVGSP